MAATLLEEPYLSPIRNIRVGLRSIYHRPNGWDYPARPENPCGESSMWGDYHARELALMLLQEARGESYLTFFDYDLPMADLFKLTPSDAENTGVSVSRCQTWRRSPL